MATTEALPGMDVMDAAEAVGAEYFIHAGQAARSYSCGNVLAEKFFRADQVTVRYSLITPVGFNNHADALSWVYAAASYSLMTPPRIFVLGIRLAGNRMTFGSSSNALRFSPWP